LGKAYTYLRSEMYCQSLRCYELLPCPVHQDPEGLLGGLWSGQQRSSTGSSDFKWSLSLLADQGFPSAFGSALEGGALTPLKGTYNPEARAIMLIKQVGERTFKYEGHLFWSETSEWCIRGHWRCEGQPELSGAFGCCRENNSPPELLSGMWMGKAVPDAQFRASIPTNPIKWSLTLAKAIGDVSIFGGGYFNDSGDIDETPVLCYSLRGEWKGDSNVRIVKHYEHEEAEGYDIVYEGTLSKENDNFWLKGAWKNEKGRSFGTFACRYCLTR